MFKIINLIFCFQTIVSKEKAYEYIVVGGGTAGGTLAVELASSGHRTLLIEAGPEIKNDVNVTVPGFHARATEDPKITFNYMVKHFENQNDVLYPRGSVLGGSSIQNAMISVYPNQRDFDYMVSITGNSSWSEKNMRYYYNKIKMNWFTFKYQKFDKSLFKKLEIGELLDHISPSVDDPDINEYNQNGLNTDTEGNKFIPTNIDKNGKRGWFEKYIEREAENPNLDIWTDTFVSKVLFNNDDIPKAVGVEYYKGKHLYKASPLYKNNKSLKSNVVYASKEIILSAGVFNTPQLLMLSGIGDRKHLEHNGIKVIKELKNVGRNLQDRYEIPVVIEFPHNLGISEGCTMSPSMDDACFKEYVINKSGTYTTNGLLSCQFIKSSPDLKEPDVYILNIPGEFYGYRKRWSDDYSKSFNKFTQLIIKARTKNKQGYVKLKNKNPFETPNINFNYFTEGGDYDMNILLNQIKKQRSFLNGLNSNHTEHMPGINVKTNKQIKEYIKESSWGHHACCTAKMGKDSINDVVDEKFRVHGVLNLRVVDASVFPEIPGYFPVVFIHMIAMKAATSILETNS